MGLRFHYTLQLTDDLWQGFHINRENIYSLNKQSQTISLEFIDSNEHHCLDESKKLKELAKWQQNIQPLTVLNLTTFEIPNESFYFASMRANGKMSLPSPVPSPSHCISQTALHPLCLHQQKCMKKTKDVICLLSILSVFSYLIQKRDHTKGRNSQPITPTSVVNDLICISECAWRKNHPWIIKKAKSTLVKTKHRNQNSFPVL